MKNRLIQHIAGWLLIGLAGSCVDPYRPPEIASPATYLVVNGFFDSAPGSTTSIRLSRSQNLSDAKTPTAETKATVTIESAKKVTYALKESTAGVYSLTNVVPQTGETYRLHIRTAAGAEFYSDYVPVVTTPAIDSVGWSVQDEGVQIHVSTHDPRNQTHYYRWEFDETWAYTAAHFSSYVYNEKTRAIDLRQENIYNCWGSASSRNILTTSTTRLTQDVVSRFPLTRIEGTSMKFQSRYSILVRQFALTQAGYEYYDQLAKITQNIGSLFDPQPSQITGNIRSASNPTDLALGFFRVGTVATKRIFIQRVQLPTWRTATNYDLCLVDTMTLGEIRQYLPGIITDAGTPAPMYLTTSLNCIDCRMQGGVTKKPDFWDN